MNFLQCSNPAVLLVSNEEKIACLEIIEGQWLNRRCGTMPSIASLRRSQESNHKVHDGILRVCRVHVAIVPSFCLFCQLSV